MMNKCIIFLSKKENYIKSAVKIKKQANFPVEILYVEDYVKNKNIIKNSIIYFLCNSYLIKDIINKKLYNCYIYNKNFFKYNYEKLEMQLLLKSKNIKIPELISKEHIDKINSPVFCKENKHGGIVLKTYTRNTILRFFEKFNKDDFYLEKSIDLKEELKLYFVKNKIFSKTNINNSVKKIVIEVSQNLDLEIFSLDLVKDIRDDYYVIDVNPSAGFYMLDSARGCLINDIINILKKEG